MTLISIATPMVLTVLITKEFNQCNLTQIVKELFNPRTSCQSSASTLVEFHQKDPVNTRWDDWNAKEKSIARKCQSHVKIYGVMDRQ